MGSSPSPTLVKLGAAARRYREAAGLLQAQVAQRVNYSEGWLSNVETAQLRPKRAAVVALEGALGVPEGALTDLYDLVANETLPGWFRPWLEDERKATVLRTFEQMIVPGLLQVEDYARALLAGDETAVATRMERQQILAQEGPPTLRCVIDEMALHRRIGEPAVMHAQLEHLLAVISPKVAIQVVPADRNPHRMGAFTIATVDGRDVAYVETAVRGMVTAAREDLSHLSDAWESVRTFALSQQESIDLIGGIMAEKWS